MSIPGLDPQPKAFFTNHPQNYTPTTSGEQLQLGDVKSMVVENKPTVMNPTIFYRMPKMPIKDLKAEESLVMEPINPNDVSREKVIASDPADTEKSSVPVEAMHVSPKSRVSPTSTETLAIEILPQPGTSRDANELDSGGSTSAPAVASQSQPNVASEMVPAKKGTAKIQAGASDVEESDDDAGTEKGVDAPTEIVNHSDHGGQIRHDTREPAPADPPTESRPGRARDGIVSERFSARDAAATPVSSRKNPTTMQSARPAHASASPESDHVETVGTTTKTQGDDPQTLSAGSNLRPAETAAAINPPAFPPAGHATSVTPSSRPETADPLPPQPQGTERASLPGNLEQSILEQVSKSLIVRQGSNPPEIRITMKPESLGEVVMKVKMEGGRVSAQIDVNSTTVKTVLESNVPQLRDMMASRGIDLQRIDIVAEGQTSLGSSSGQNRSRQKSRSNEKGGIESLDEYDSLRALGYNTMELIM
ncbi:MAG TPA: flagellar hook-length control protein FliK [Bacteroidota bacterium]|nr:flagellar hook-length control protein FliK [Bacteroidota bacterium]